jgi:hypothetical protein
MKKLIEALTIFAKYQDLEWPTHCEHDVLHVVGITKEEVSEEDQKRLDALGFIWSDEDDGSWISFHFGRA